MLLPGFLDAYAGVRVEAPPPRPKAEHEAKEWQAAMEALILLGTKGGPATNEQNFVMRRSAWAARRVVF